MPSTDNKNKYAPTKWGTSNEFDFECPSGQVCRLRRIDPVDLAATGLLSKLDWLTATVLNEHIPNGRKTAAQKAKESKANVGKSKQEVEEELRAKAYKGLLDNPDRLAKFKSTVDDVLILAVVEPPLALPPQPTNEDPSPSREEGQVYTDTIDFNDKMAIFNLATKGVSELEPFREGSEEPVVPVASVESIQQPTKRRARPKS